MDDYTTPIGTDADSALPGVLGKACDDPNWAYACELKNGRCYLFTGVTDLGGGWIKLHEWSDSYGMFGDLENVTHDPCYAVPERGLTVPLSEVRWAAEVRG